MISTHILDTSLGAPAADVKVKLQIHQNGAWQELNSGNTNADGRYVFDCETPSGQYQIVFGIEAYQKKTTPKSFFLDATVGFKTDASQPKYHVPLLLNPYGYSTYKGS